MIRNINDGPVVDVALAELVPHPRNVNEADIGAIGSSVEAHGFYGAVIVQRSTGQILAGNHRYQVALQSGAVTIPVQYVDVNDETALRILIADNRTTRLGRDDPAGLSALLADLAGTPSGLDGLGYDSDDLDALLTGLLAANNDDGEVIDPPAAPATKPGDLWVLGEHRLVCGDATDTDTLNRLLGDETAGLLVTDPPYGVSYADKNEYLNAIGRPNSVEVPIEGDHQTPKQMSELWRAAFSAVRDVLDPGSCYYVTGPQGGDLLLLLLALRESGFPLRHMLIWAKNQFVIGRSDYNYQHEPVIHGWVEGAAHKFFGVAGESSVWQIDKPHQSKFHPTMKPVELFARAIGNSSPVGGLVLDPFAGSGTTAIACEQLGRRARLVEIDPAYCDVICRRWQTMTNQKPMRDGMAHDFS